MKVWEIVKEMNDDDGKPTCWGTETEDGGYAWITLDSYGEYNVEINTLSGVVPVKKFKTLNEAKKWVSINL